MNIEDMSYNDERALNDDLSDSNNGRAKFFLSIVLLRRSVGLLGSIIAVVGLVNSILLGLVLWRVW
jgi:hypothetical protein